jgi:hypothetical protein
MYPETSMLQLKGCAVTRVFVPKELSWPGDYAGSPLGDYYSLPVRVKVAFMGWD